MFSISAVVVAAAVSLLFVRTAACAADFDIIIERGRIVDGTGSPWYVADVGIKDGRITRIGRLAGEAAERRLVAEGLVVAPGFIDMMGQTVNPLIDEPKAALNLLTQGITTVNAGEGSSAAPLAGAEARSEGWRSMAEYFHVVELRGLPLNLAQTVGHTQIRRQVIGEDNRKPAPDELARMKNLVREAMEAGAVGLSTALIYPPATFADTEEISALAAVAGESGGRYFTHMRNEGNQLLEAIDEALEIGRKARTPVHIFHLKTAGRDNWPKMEQAIAKIRAARAAGQEVAADMYPYVNSGVYIESLIHPRHFTKGLPEFRSRLDDHELRRTIRSEMESDEGGWENWYKHTGRDWNKVLVGKSNSVRYRVERGQSIGAAAKALSVDPWDLFFDLVRTGTLVMPETMSGDNKRRLMREDFVSYCTDAGPSSSEALTSHPRACGSFPRVLSRYVRSEGVITLEQAVARASALAANEVMARDRGRIAEGLAADVIVFDYQNLTDRADYAHPHRLSEGMKYVIVNGQLVLADGKMTNARPGRVLRGPGYRRDLAPPAVVTGEPVPDFTGVDKLMQDFLAEHSIPGASVAVTDGGRLVYARAFGYADVAAREKVVPESLFRIASISKPVTSAAIFRLLERGKLTLDSKFFELLDKYEPPAPDAKVDPRLAGITIRQLLQHSGGWDRDKSFDAMFRPVEFARALKLPPPAGPDEVIRNMMAQPLDFDPGVRQAYSNYGYCLLGRVIEKLTGQSYEAAVRECILDPSGARTMTLGRSLPELRREGEVRYYTSDRGPSVFDANLGQRVPYPYGGWNLEAMDSHGAWLASCLDLARFAVSFDDNGDGTLLQRPSLDAMFARPSGTAGLDDKGQPKDFCYAAGWGRRETSAGPEFSHSGALSGTSTLLVKRPDGRNWIVLFNTRGGPRADFFPTALKPKMSRVLDEIKTWPAHDLFAKFPKHQPAPAPASAPEPKAEKESPAPPKITGGGREPAWYLHARGGVIPAFKVHSVWPFSAEEAKQWQAETASALKIPVRKSIRLTDGVEVPFQLIPAGKFMMGSPESEDGHEGDERQHPETIHEPFYMMETQLTVAQYTALMQSPPPEAGARDMPAGIHYRDTVDKVLPALAKLAPSGWKVILPDHVRLEYAARAGVGTMNPGGNKPEDAAPFAWYRENSGGQVQPVARKSPNAWGLHDVIGNRWHWFWRAGKGYGDESTDDHIVYGGHARSESGGNGVRLANIMISRNPEGARFALIRSDAEAPGGHPETKQPAR